MLLLATYWTEPGRGVQIEPDGWATPSSMRTGHVSFLYKKGDKTDLANSRPITLLTTDYKILTKVITMRMRSVVGKVMHPDQTCGTRPLLLLKFDFDQRCYCVG